MRIGALRAFTYLFLLSLVACGINKPTSLTHMAYHDLTARYNRYFNAKLLLLEAAQYFQESHQDNYQEILPLYIEGTPTTAQSVFGDMDEVIKKASANIKLHENSKWSDDAYFQIGKASYYKRDFEKALKAFVFVTSEFDEGLRLKEPKNKGNKRNNDDDPTENPYYDETLSFAKHKPARYEAIIWIIKTYTHLEEWSKAQSIISLARGDRDFPDDLKDELAVAAANYYIVRKDYNGAIRSLKEAILLSEDKDKERRYTFILAQVHRRAGLNTMAIQYFNEVLEMNPGFEMEFQAKIKIAEISKEENLYSNSQVIALLRDMLKDDKYRLFKGQIYFTLAEIYLKQGDIEQAVDNFLLSVRHSRDDNARQAAAYRQLADLYFIRDDYRTAQMYHDSTLAVMSTTHSAYDSLVDRNVVLKNLITNLDIIERQDSLQYLAGLSEEELQAYIEEQEKKARAKQQALEEASEEEETFTPLIGDNENSGAVAWPFDDPSLRSRGYNLFKQTWGDRPRVDYWRISSKAESFVAQNQSKTDTAGGDSAVVASPEGGIDLENLPKTPEAMAASNQKMMDAYYNLGNLYREELKDEVQAIAAFETLMARFPDNPYRLETAYSLYLMYKGQQQKLADKYKRLILDEFPESTIAKVLVNPNYLEEQKAKERQLQDYYATTYTYFSQNDLMTALERKQRAEKLFPNNPLQPKFDMLEALIYGKLGKYDTCKQALQQIVNKYPYDEVKNKAITMLNLLEGRGYATNEGNMEANNYQLEPEAEHYMCILIKDPEIDVMQLQNRIASFNDEFFRLKNLTITPVPLNNELQLILIKAFDNAEKAKTYYNTIRYNKSVIGGMAEEDFNMFYVTKRNYGVFFRQKDITNYMTFFTQHYLQEP